MVRLLVAVGFGAFIVLFVILPLSLRSGAGNPEYSLSALVLEGALLGAAALIATWALFYLLRKLEPLLDANALAQAQFLDTLDPRHVDLAILFSAALSLFLELALIRWQSSVLESSRRSTRTSAFWRALPALGLGYALAARTRIPLLMVVPLLAAQFCFILLVRLSCRSILSVNPFREQLTMGLQQGDWVEARVLFLLLSVLFSCSPPLTFVPIGQLCGRLMERRQNLRAYGLNLLGSLVGVVVMLVASLLWTPPLVWFAVCFLAIRAVSRAAAVVAGRRHRFQPRLHHRARMVADRPAVEPRLFALSIGGGRHRSGNRADAHSRRRALLSAHPHFSPYNRRRAGRSRLLRLSLQSPSGPQRRCQSSGSGTGNDVAAALRAEHGRCRCHRDRPGHSSGRRGAPSRKALRRTRESASSTTTPAPSFAARREQLRPDRLWVARFPYASQPRFERAARFFRLHDRGPARSEKPAQARRHGVVVVHRAVGSPGAQDFLDAAGCL